MCAWQGDVIVVCGVKHCAFYTLDGNNLTRRNAVVGNKGKLSKMMCIAWAGSDAVIGTSAGKLYKFREHVLQQVWCILHAYFWCVCVCVYEDLL